jgi:acetylornithine deacetylase/succinyl-diaminopimelate desuccinylase-like protein
MTDQAALDAALAYVDSDLDASLERLNAWLRIPSISTDPAYAEQCKAAADWLTEDLRSMGFDAATNPTDGHPVVTGHDRSAGGPTALFYGHYDVQPVDPLELWDHDPFEPFVETRADGTRCIRGRGTADDKGQVMTFVEACRAWKATAGRLPLGVTLMIEGEEESGGKHLPPFMEANKDALKADIGLICDTGMWDRDTPAITTMLRGMCGEEIVITAADRDLHSGFYGGAAANPNHVLARILADLHDETGRVTIPGFYDGVPELPQALRDQWQGLGFDPDAFLGDVDLSVPAGERGRSALEMVWSRPTCEINGMGGGYQGAGFKTVIPSKASAKISCRLVFDQDPHAIRAAFRDFVRARVPADCEVEFIQHGSAKAVAYDTAAGAFSASAAALTDEWDREAVFIGCGGSIPINHEFKNILGMDVVLVGFGLPDDRLHSPNEKYDMTSFHKGIRSWVRILAKLAESE